MARESAKEGITPRLLRHSEIQFNLLVGVHQRSGPNDLVDPRHEMLGEGIGILSHLVGQLTHLFSRAGLHDDEVVNLDIRVVESQLHLGSGGETKLRG